MHLCRAIPPPLTWAQRKTIIYITVEVEDFRPTKVAVDGKELTICGSSAATNAQYDVKLGLFAEVEAVSALLPFDYSNSHTPFCAGHEAASIQSRPSRSGANEEE